jgi:predicted RNA methylase
MIDIHYTPNELAAAMVECIPEGFIPSTIADFSAGEGSLLYEAARRWPSAMIFANDLNKVSSRMLASRNQAWSVSCSDFLKATSHTHTKFSSKKGSIDLILLNPPFSERGRRPVEWFDRDNLKSGLATRFVHLSLSYLSSDGYMLAILPNGSLTSERDSQAWAHIREKYSVEIIIDNHMRIFKNAAARTSIVFIRKKTSNSDGQAPRSSFKSSALNIIRRGRIQMHSVNSASRGFPLVHTTELTGGKAMVNASHGLVLSTTIIRGPALLFPRVGMVTPEKVCVLDDGVTVTLSDCVLAIEFQDSARLTAARDYVIRDWLCFSSIYGGTGAKYTTVKKAESYFQMLMAALEVSGVRLNNSFEYGRVNSQSMHLFT